MKKLIFAASGWKKLQKDYIEKDLRALNVRRLHKVLEEDLSGYSFEEAVIHYTAMSLSAMMTGVAGYMQEGTLEHAEYYFYLSVMAKLSASQLMIANPHKQAEQAQEIQMDCMALAILSGCVPAALGLLDAAETILEQEQKQSDRNQKNRQQAVNRRKRISLETAFYRSLLQNNDEKARSLLSDLSEFRPDDPFMQVLRAFFSQDDEAFSNALIQHMKEFRNTPYPGELNYFVLFMEALYQKRRSAAALDFADAPAALLKLPECDPTRTKEAIGIDLPGFGLDDILRVLDKNKIGPKFKQY